MNYQYTEYFEKHVLRKRPYLQKHWCEQVLVRSYKFEPQEGNRFRFWGAVDELDGRYLRVVTLADILRRVPAYIKNRAKRQATRLPKVHFIDTGLAAHLLGLRKPEVLLKSQFYGGLLESLIYMECYKQAGWADEEVSLMHFRDTQRNEVDLVMERADGGIIGVEIKASASFRLEDFRGLAALAEHAGPHFQHGVLIYTGDKVLPVKTGKQTFHAVPVGLFGF